MTDTQTLQAPKESAEETTTKPKPKKALISVYDKTDVVELARGLHALGWEILSSGGTAKKIAEKGIPVTDVAELTGYPAILGHRVVTLHPKVHGGILADRNDPDHRADMVDYDIEAIDLVVVNLYPFSSDPSIELIDIGGPAMVRAAAKNHEYVGVVVDPNDYSEVLEELAETDDGMLTPSTRKRLAYKAYDTTSNYDAQIRSWIRTENPELFEDVVVRAPYCILDGIETLRAGSMYACPVCGSVFPGLAPDQVG
ncbi:hypothetical protein HYX70_05005 [Candidatus Saccharibacteria bacterium]|nr:hypothetical protein [Candidatus Saccharibacteria bacterium]